ncbi:MAG: hypothetical protein AB8B85_16740 [Paracoccaceae bacterium]
MFKDDRMMSFLTAIIIMVAVGTVIQKAGSGADDDPSNGVAASAQFRLIDDTVTIAAGQQAEIHVLANDTGVNTDRSRGLSVLRAPDCGWIAVRGSVLEYLPDASCVGERRIVYTIPDASGGDTATVFISVIKPAESAKPAIPSVAKQVSAPQRPEPARQLSPSTPEDGALAATQSEPAEAPSPVLEKAAEDQVGRGTPKRLATLSQQSISATNETVDGRSSVADTTIHSAGPRAQAPIEDIEVSDNRILVAVRDIKEPLTSSPVTPLGTLLPIENANLPDIDARAEGEETVDRSLVAALGQAAAGGLGDALADLPVDLSQSPLENAPNTAPAPAPRVTRNVDIASVDSEGGRHSDRAGLPARPPEIDARRAALPQSDANCVTPPSSAIDVMRAGRTRLSIIAPCQANTVAELNYSGIRFAMPIDSEGKGQILTLGFEANAQAVLQFVDGVRVDFDLPFKSVDRVARVALVWDLPVDLELNALEFGADPGSNDHVRPENRRSFSEVRRQGGGFLHSFRSAEGVGQNVDVYSHWRRAGGPNGIVRMMIDFASRNRDQLPETCGNGSLAEPQFLVMRSDGGQLERPILRRLASLDCSEISREYGDNGLISDGIADLLIR